MNLIGITLGFMALGVTWCVAWLFLDLPLVFLSPDLIVGVATLAGGLIIGWAIGLRRGSVRHWAAFVALMAGFLGTLVPLRGSPIGRFKVAYRTIRPGMTHAEVMAIIDRQFPDKKPAIGIQPDGGGYVNLGPVDPGFNGEAFGVTISNGCVVSKEYLPD